MNVRYSKESYDLIDFYNFKYNNTSISISLTKNPSGNELELSQFLTQETRVMENDYYAMF